MTKQEFNNLPSQRRGKGLASNAKFRAKVSNGIISKEDFIASGLGNEAELQKKCVKWFRTNHHNLRRLLTHDTNGEQLAGGAKSWERRKALGAVAGAADLTLKIASGDYGYLDIELKTIRGTQSITQKAMEQDVVGLGGGGYALVRSLDEFIRVVTSYLETGTY